MKGGIPVVLLHPDLRAVNERLSFVRILLDLVVVKSELRSWDEMLGCQPWSITSRIVIELEGGNGGGHVSSAPPRTPPWVPHTPCIILDKRHPNEGAG